MSHLRNLVNALEQNPIRVVDNVSQALDMVERYKWEMHICCKYTRPIKVVASSIQQSKTALLISRARNVAICSILRMVGK
jgi:hypothetical protein